MILNIIQPKNNETAKIVESFIYYSGYSAPLDFETILPNAASQLIIELDGNNRCVYDKGQKKVFNKSWFVGVQTQPLTYFSEKNATTLCVVFSQTGLFSITGIPSKSFVDAIFDAESVMGPSVNDLRNRLLEIESINDIVDHVEQYLLAKCRRLKHNIVNEVLYRLGLNQPLNKISKELKVSEKHIIALFTKYVGVTPIKFKRLMRFSGQLTNMNNKSMPHDLSEYFDQSHFIKEFTSFSGFSPSTYLAMDKEYPHVISHHSTWF